MNIINPVCQFGQEVAACHPQFYKPEVQPFSWEEEAAEPHSFRIRNCPMDEWDTDLSIKQNVGPSF